MLATPSDGSGKADWRLYAYIPKMWRRGYDVVCCGCMLGDQALASEGVEADQ